MDKKDFLRLTNQLKKAVEDACQLDSDLIKAPYLVDISKYACLILERKRVAYQKTLPIKNEADRCLFFTGIDTILSSLFQEYFSLNIEKRIKLSENLSFTPKSTVERNKALETIHGALSLLTTDWVTLCWI